MKTLVRFVGRLLTVGVIFYACSISTVLSQKLEHIILRPGMDPFHHGHSVNRVITQQKGKCVKVTDADLVVSNNALSQELRVDFVDSVSEFSKAVGISAYAAYFGPMAKYTASISDRDERFELEQRTSLYVRVYVEGIVKTVRDPQPTDDVKRMFTDDPSGKLFSATCGDSFVYQTVEGAELLAVITFRSMDKTTYTQFKADLEAQFKGAVAGAEVGVDITKRVVTKMREFNMKAHVTQVGLGSVAVPDFFDAQALLDYARTFAQKSKSTSETKPYRVVLQRFADAPAFTLMMFKANKQNLFKFDASIEYMEQVMLAYQLARDRKDTALAAINSPKLFKTFDKEKVEAYLDEITVTVDYLTELASDCVAAVERQEICRSKDQETKKDPQKKAELKNKLVGKLKLKVPYLDPELERIPQCPLTQGSGCVAASYIDGACKCTRCTFGDEEQQMNHDVLYTKVCENMPVGYPVQISFRGNLGHQATNTDAMTLNMIFRVHQETPKQLTNINNVQWVEDIYLFSKATVDKDGRLVVGYRFDLCQVNRPPGSTCIIKPTKYRAYMFDISAGTK